MTEDEIRDLFTYRPSPTARRKRLIAEAIEVYRMGREQCRHQPILNSYEGQLRKFYLYPTFNCPLRCPYCYAEGGERNVKELPPADFLRITQEAVDAGYRSVVLVGGEPLVYYGFSEYLDGLFQLEKKDCKFILRTSFAFPVEEERMKKICAVFDEIVVSLDGDEDTNDALRGEGSFKHTVTNVDRALDISGCVSINAVMTAEQGNGSDGEFLRSFCKERNISRLVLSSPVPMGRAADTDVPFYEWHSNLKQSEEIRPKYSCGLGHSLYMQPDGSVFPCYAWCEKEHQVGDLSKESLKEVLDRGEILSIINSGVDTNEKCRSCEVRYFCGGRCKIWVRNRKDLNSGDFDCEAMKKSMLETLKRYEINVF